MTASGAHSGPCHAWHSALARLRLPATADGSEFLWPGSIYERAVAGWNAQRQPGGSGGDFYNTKIAYLGREYIALAFQQYHQNRIDDEQLAEYLDTKPRNVGTLEEYFTAGTP